MKKSEAKKPLTWYFGNLLMGFAFALLLFIYFPIIQLYFFPNNFQTEITKKGNFIEIPKIKARAPIVLNVDPWTQEDYQKQLKNGVAHAKGTSLPGEKGMIFLFAHSSDLPWRITRNNTAFFKLNKLKNGDTILLHKDGLKYTYKVKETKTVWPSEVSYLLGKDKDILILQTCTPPGTSFKRLLVFAEKN